MTTPARAAQLKAVAAAVTESEREHAVTFHGKRVFRAWRSVATSQAWLRELVGTVHKQMPASLRGRCDAPALVSTLARLGYCESEMLSMALEVSETSLADRLRGSAPPAFVTMLKRHMRSVSPLSPEAIGSLHEQLVDIHPRSMTCRPADLVDEPTRQMLARAHELERRTCDRNKALAAELASVRLESSGVQAELEERTAALAEARRQLAATQLERDEASAIDRVSSKSRCNA